MTQPNEFETSHEHLMPVLVTETVPYLGGIALEDGVEEQSTKPQYIPEYLQ